MSVGSRIKELREFKNISRNQLAEKIGVTPGAISNYENGVSSPKEPILFKVMEILKCDANYLYQDDMDTKPSVFTTTLLEQNIIDNYRHLSISGKTSVEKHIDNLLAYESELKKMQIKESPTEIYQISVPTTTRSYAAGAGSIVYDGDDQVTDLNYPSDRVPKETDFASRVEGDSMEPTFIDGDIIFVKHAEILKIGEIGLFNINGENYIKECGKDGLISHNKKYPLITPTSQDTLVCIGRVLGKL